MGRKYLKGGVLPTVLVVAAVMLTVQLGLLTLWQSEAHRFARAARLMQARSDVEAAYTLYALHPADAALTDPAGYRLHDSLPQSRVTIRVREWGLYELVYVATADSLVRVCRLMGAEPEAGTLYAVDNGSALTLAGRTELHGVLFLPQNGFAYGRVGAELFRGRAVAQGAVRRSAGALPAPDSLARMRVAALFARRPDGTLADSLFRSFHDPAAVIRADDDLPAGLSLRGHIILCGDEVRIDSACRLEHLLVVARKITVGRGARIAAQLFARDTVLIEARAVLEYPSGVYAGRHVCLGERTEVDGYVIVRGEPKPQRVAAAYRQARTARLRGMLWVDGAAQAEGIVAGSAMMKEAACFTPQGYYRNTVCDLTVLVNRTTAHPIWLCTGRRKETACVD